MLTFNGKNEDNFIQDHPGIDNITFTKNIIFYTNDKFKTTQNVSIICQLKNTNHTLNIEFEVSYWRHCYPTENSSSTIALTKKTGGRLVVAMKEFSQSFQDCLKCNGTLIFNEKELKNGTDFIEHPFSKKLEIHITNSSDQSENANLSCTFVNGVRTEISASIIEIEAKSSETVKSRSETNGVVWAISGSLASVFGVMLLVLAIFIQKRSKKGKKFELVTVPLFEADKMDKVYQRPSSLLDEEEEEVIFCGLSFPKSCVKDFGDFTTEMRIGEGQFGTVSMGFLDIGIGR